MVSTCDYVCFAECTSLSQLFLSRIARSPGSIAYRFFNRAVEQWQELTWQQTLAHVVRWREALQQEGFSKGDRVAVMLGNSLEWLCFEQAALSLGLIVVPLYANDRAENIAYILNHTEARLLLCSETAFRLTLHASLALAESLQRIVVIAESTAPTTSSDHRVRSLNDWLPALTAAQDDLRITTFTPITHDPATIVYTSGTTGNPKGVMLSHQNILSNCQGGLSCMEIYPEDNFLSFLPLSHMLERTAGYYMPMMAGATVTFARSVLDLAEDLITIQPTILVAVPRIFEKIYNNLMTMLSSRPRIMKTLFGLAVSSGYQSFEHHQGRKGWSALELAEPVLDTLIARKVRDRLGGRLRIIIAGGAPLSATIARFFIGLGLPIYQGYGLTETSPVISVNRQKDNRPETVGSPLPGTEVRIGEHDELLVRGPGIMQGYWRNERATEATIDAEGWLYTGDKAIMEDGHIRITGRLKEIIVLSNGEKIAPADIEMAITMDPLFENCLVIGEGHPFLTLLAVLNTTLWKELAAQLGVPDEESSLHTDEVRRAILKRIENLLTGFPGYVFIKDVGLSLTPWSVESGLLTPTLKLRRSVIQKHLAKELARMYEE